MARDQIRQSQLVLSFGPGAMLDLPRDSVLVSGLQHWIYRGDELSKSIVTEPRLQSKLGQRFRIGSMELRRPPRAAESEQQPESCVPAFRFPQWFVAEPEARRETGYYRRRLVKHSELQGGRFVDGERKLNVVPVRFVRACVRGHLADIDWKWLLHGAGSDCTAPKWIEERGNTGDLGDVFVTCDCGKRVKMNDVAAQKMNRLGQCQGDRPWLGDHAREECDKPWRLLIRNATNAYFPERMTVISIPAKSLAADERVASVFDLLSQFAHERQGLDYGRKIEPLKTGLEGMLTQDVWTAYDRISTGAPAVARSVKEEELEAITGAAMEQSSDEPEGDFYARELKLESPRKPWMKPIARVILLHRLRAVSALVGFTRFEPSGADIHGELDIDVESAALAQEPRWLPATESRGEGVYVELDSTAVQQWLQAPSVRQRQLELEGGLLAWKATHPETAREHPGTAYTLLHTLAHLLMTSIALECGYPASSLQERIYTVRPGPGAKERFGLLIYTASNDAEGTLGGLIQAGRNIARHLRAALESARLCSNDPVCAQHDPKAPGSEHLSGAACHGCAIAPETSCEMRNEFLDRALVVPTVHCKDAAFFGEFFA